MCMTLDLVEPVTIGLLCIDSDRRCGSTISLLHISVQFWKFSSQRYLISTLVSVEILFFIYVCACIFKYIIMVSFAVYIPQFLSPVFSFYNSIQLNHHCFPLSQTYYYVFLLLYAQNKAGLSKCRDILQENKHQATLIKCHKHSYVVVIQFTEGEQIATKALLVYLDHQRIYLPYVRTRCLKNNVPYTGCDTKCLNRSMLEMSYLYCDQHLL